MEFDHFEEKLNKKFKAFQPQLNETGLWENIETQLGPAKEERRVGWFWLLASGSALVAIVVFWTLTSLESKDTMQEVNLSEVVGVSQEIEANKAISTTADINSVSDEIQHVSDTKEMILDEAVLETHDKHSSLNDELLANEELSSVNNSKVAPRLAKTLDSQSMDKYSSLSREPAVSDSKVKVSDDQVIIQEVSQVSSASAIQVNLIPNLSFILSHNRDVILIDMELRPVVQNTPVVVEEVSSRFSFSTGLGYSKITTDLQLIDNSFENLLALREQSEFELEALTTEIRLNYHLSDSWTLISGVHYSMINTGTETSHSTSKIDLVTDTVAIIRSFTGVRYEEDLVPEITTKTSKMMRYNQFHNVTLPLGISYSLGFGRHYTWNVGVIYELGLYNSNNGFEQDEGLLEYNMSTDSESRFKRGGLNNILVETQLHKHIGERSSIFLGLQYRRGLSNIYNNNYSIKKRIDLSGMSAGISVSL